ncbi:TIGR01777 family oxidoreductase [Roseivirga misakiensis]|uniref:TIGR01777 family protein n=1 Tax=Roseivirga misakiensis TaxID=1563681 RepID=A0A1E5T6Q6_9BACT|nr:TIGR01777 family oxidoreductase [Roseivirga misakiensis]OEK07026.1 TIGR01777 family protein [Roseivirga misakiensis]
MGQKILITGGTGLVGSALIPMLKKQGHEIVVLSRKKSRNADYEVFEWDYKKDYIEEGALEGVDSIIHLAGAGVADEKWTVERKDEIYNSRTKTSILLFKTLEKGNHQVKSFIAASAIGIYGNDTGNSIVSETSATGSGFLAHVTDAWETATNKIKSLNIRLVQLRVGIVLSKKGGALVELLKPPVAAPLGKGDQYMSWIHIGDLSRMFVEAVENSAMEGAFNAVAPSPETNKNLTRKAAKAFKKTFLPIPVPALVIKLMLGEMSTIVLGGSRVSSAKIQREGFEFKYPKLDKALDDLGA